MSRQKEITLNRKQKLNLTKIVRGDTKNFRAYREGIHEYVYIERNGFAFTYIWRDAIMVWLPIKEEPIIDEVIDDAVE
jgi:hypothetical protein